MTTENKGRKFILFNVSFIYFHPTQQACVFPVLSPIEGATYIRSTFFYQTLSEKSYIMNRKPIRYEDFQQNTLNVKISNLQFFEWFLCIYFYCTSFAFSCMYAFLNCEKRIKLFELCLFFCWCLIMQSCDQFSNGSSALISVSLSINYFLYYFSAGRHKLIALIFTVINKVLVFI